MDWMNLVGVALGGALTMAGNWLQGRSSRRTERDKLSNDAVLKARDALLEIEGMKTRWYDLKDGTRVPVHPDLTGVVQRIRSETMLIPDDKARKRLDQVAGLLLRSDAIAAFHSDYQTLVRQRLCDWGREVLSAHLRGSKLSQTPAFLQEYEEAITESEDMLEAIASETAGEIEPGPDEPDA